MLPMDNVGVPNGCLISEEKIRKRGIAAVLLYNSSLPLAAVLVQL